MKNLASLVFTLITLVGLTITTVLYGDGWRLNLGREKTQDTITRAPIVIKTGMLAVRSMPDGAKVYIDNKLETATDDTITSLSPGKYSLRIEKEGFETWEKNVDVYSELVTDITAVLVLQSPRLDPLTNTDVKAYALSSNQNNIAFLTKNHKEPGIWILPLTGSPLNLFRNNSRLLIEDTPFATPSLGKSVWWSPDDKEVLVQMNKTGYFLYATNNQGKTNILPQSFTDIGSTHARWQAKWAEDFLQDKLEQITSELDAPEKVLAKAAEAKWSRDDEKFFFYDKSTDNPNETSVYVYNAEDPLPVGEQRLYETYRIENSELTSIYWYSDSYHLVIVEQESEDSQNYTISMIRIDGTNMTPIYNGYLASNQAYPTPTGDKILVLTALKENSPMNIYGIAIR